MKRSCRTVAPQVWVDGPWIVNKQMINNYKVENEGKKKKKSFDKMINELVNIYLEQFRWPSIRISSGATVLQVYETVKYNIVIKNHIDVNLAMWSWILLQKMKKNEYQMEETSKIKDLFKQSCL